MSAKPHTNPLLLTPLPSFSKWYRLDVPTCFAYKQGPGTPMKCRPEEHLSASHIARNITRIWVKVKPRANWRGALLNCKKFRLLLPPSVEVVRYDAETLQPPSLS